MKILLGVCILALDWECEVRVCNPQPLTIPESCGKSPHPGYWLWLLFNWVIPNALRVSFKSVSAVGVSPGNILIANWPLISQPNSLFDSMINISNFLNLFFQSLFKLQSSWPTHIFLSLNFWLLSKLRQWANPGEWPLYVFNYTDNAFGNLITSCPWVFPLASKS